jgi:hypothetical protein
MIMPAAAGKNLSKKSSLKDAGLYLGIRKTLVEFTIWHIALQKKIPA